MFPKPSAVSDVYCGALFLTIAAKLPDVSCAVRAVDCATFVVLAASGGTMAQLKHTCGGYSNLIYWLTQNEPDLENVNVKKVDLQMEINPKKALNDLQVLQARGVDVADAEEGFELVAYRKKGPEKKMAKKGASRGCTPLAPRSTCSHTRTARTRSV